MKNTLVILGLIIGFTSCSQNESSESLTTADAKSQNNMAIKSTDFPVGTAYTGSKVAAPGAYNQLKQNLKKNDAIGIIAEVDHSKNANSIGENLDYTKIIFFGNPNLGTPLMQRNQLAGLDLPQKVLFYRDENKDNIALYNSVSYLESRHGLEGVPTLDKISAALKNLVSDATKSDIKFSSDQTVAEGAGIITKKSSKNFEATYSSLKNALSSNENISIVAELDHQENAASVGLELNPTKIIIFGNPNLGTPLMKQNQSIGLDLPQKMLVWENDEGEVFVSYNDPYFIAERHDIDGPDEILETISNALDNLSNTAIAN
ncbi:DUF302 domain-containing protein [Christiangramia forsetii]|uniref:Secreted protein containing DUF302 n=2 Tax=Christiangramia forsetii TaxID=411153 RepID=A0LY45_CHRFK|nr:DUF302 domain-containing protein [Christiangramia forsetii]GGG35021.1 hypothetical protein GCM10011532_18510 [Christiangramia forsetii]CAL65290.1 secreted protein containing DUF302 [Christiangramia forsetii KT0803]